LGGSTCGQLGSDAALAALEFLALEDAHPATTMAANRTLIEATSDNTAIALATVRAQKDSVYEPDRGKKRLIRPVKLCL
jgi:hypothetical protein